MHPSDTDSGSDSMIHYEVTAILQLTTIAKRKKKRRREEKKDSERMLSLNPKHMKEASHAGRYIPNIILTLHPLVMS